jgi:glycosyltransferase involved in cell wall biosynthesis
VANPGDDSDGYADIGTLTFVSVSPVLGGGELTVLRMAVDLSRRVPVRVLGGPDDPLLQRAREAGLAVGPLAIGTKLGRRSAASNLLRYPWARRRLQRAVSEATDAGWCLLQYKWEELLWGGEVAPERVALWEHGPIPGPLLRAPLLRRRLRSAFESSAAVFAWSAPAAADIADLCGRDAIRLEHGVDVQAAVRAAGMRSDVRSRLRIPEDALLMAYAGRVAEDKGVIEAVEALGAMPEAHLVVCGEGPASDRARSTSVGVGAEERLHMLGHVEQPLEVLAAADVSVLLTRSRGEGRPLAAIESLAVGTPVLGTAASPAMRGIAGHDGVTLVDEVSPEAVAAAVGAIVSRRRPAAERPEWAAAGRKFLDGLRRSAG